MKRTQAEIGLVNLRTGEVYASLVPVRKGLGGKWVRLFQDNKLALMLAHPEVHAQSYVVLHYLECVSTWDNVVPPAAVVAKPLRMPRTSVSRSYGELLAAEFLVQRHRTYYLSPAIAWKGTEKQLDAAYRELIPGPRLQLAGPRS